MTEMLTIVPAGAGSGKTFRIKSDLTNWVKENLVGPDRILAVTVLVCEFCRNTHSLPEPRPSRAPWPRRSGTS